MYNKKKYYLCIAFNKRHRLFAICLAELAQLVEQRIRNAWVGGSSPPFGSGVRRGVAKATLFFVRKNPFPYCLHEIIFVPLHDV